MSRKFEFLFRADSEAAAASAAEVPEDDVPGSIAQWLIELDLTPYLPESLRALWIYLHDYPVLFAIMLIGLGYGIGKFFKWILHFFLDRLAKQADHQLDYEIAHDLAKPILQTMVTLALIIALATLDFPGAIEHFLIQVCFTVLLVLWGKAWFRATAAILEALEREPDRFRLFHKRTVPLYEMVVKVVMLAVFVYLMFVVWGIDATAWVASAGIIGIVVGFAARDTLANLISGVSIVADAPYKIGDYIVIDSGERGIVTHVGIRSTRLLTRDDVEVSIPNALIGNAKIVNESGGPWVRHRIRVGIGVAYGSDLDRVCEVLEEVANENEKIVENPACRVRLRQFGDSSIDMELMGWIRMPGDRGLTVHQLLLAIDKRFKEEGIVIPFPQRDLHLIDTPDANKNKAVEADDE